ncbi:MAG: hypothetical protein ABW068_15860 [Candidatus Thiodiazotropha sp.]
MLSSNEASFNPQVFLSALGAGGLAISFFLYPQFMIPHPTSPMVTFEVLQSVMLGENSWVSVLLAVDLILILGFAFIHFHLLAKSLRAYRRFRKTDAFTALRLGNEEVSLMAIPLTLSMSVNVLLVLGALYVPGLWHVVEWLFPMALLAYVSVGIYALRIYGN